MKLSAYVTALANPRLLAVLMFGFASGLPLALTGQALQAWLTLDGIDLTTIGMFTLVGQPYAFKFLWAPLMDRFEPPFLGRRRGWLVLCQLLLAGIIFFLSTLEPASHIMLFALMATVVAFLSASQDVVVDAYRTEVAAEQERGLAAAVGVMGYRLAMLVSGGFAFLLAGSGFGWAGTYRIMALIMLGLAIYSCFAPRLVKDEKVDGASRSEFFAFSAVLLGGALSFWASWNGLSYYSFDGLAVRMLVPTACALLGVAVVAKVVSFKAWRDVLGFGWMAIGVELGYLLGRGLLHAFGFSEQSDNQWTGLLFIVTEIACAVPAALLMARLARFELLLLPMRSYFSREYAWAFLALIILYKLGDAFAGTLATSFLLKGVGFSLIEFGVVTKVVGLFATVVGALLGGLLMMRLGLWMSLFIFGLLQAATNLGYWWLAVAGKGGLGTLHLGVNWMSVFFAGKDLGQSTVGIDVLFIVAILVENLAGGMGTAALVALLMALCSDRRATATQFALLSALSALGRVYVGPSSGYLATAFGWPDFFIFSLFMATPGIVMLLCMRTAVRQLEHQAKASGET